MDTSLIQFSTFASITIAILVFFIGMRLNQRLKILRDFNIPDPVTGGIIASLIGLFMYSVFHIQLEYQYTAARDILLVYFFTTIGLNARFSDLKKGGKPLLILLTITLGYMVFQNTIGVIGAELTGQPKAVGVLAGTASLIGGHGTAIAWSDLIATEHGVPDANVIGIASATLGLVIASLLGGPISIWLMRRFKLSGSAGDTLSVGVSYEKEEVETINHVSLMRSLLVMHIAIIMGNMVYEYLKLEHPDFKIPLFVPCLFMAIILSNTIPLFFKKLPWPAHTRALATISDFSLGLFIAMSLMSMQLWSIASLAGPLLTILLLQAIAAAIFIRFILFPLMGKNYQAAVLSAGFAGFSLGATPTAIANMSAVTKRNGPAPTAFIILPLVGAFFVDLANSFIIQFFLSL